MLKIENLSYRYRGRDEWTLKNINLNIETGEMVLLAGRSGCGKSTLLKAISGLLGTTGSGTLEGEIFLQSEAATSKSPEEIGLLVGTVYQTPEDQLFAMTVGDEVGFALENQGLPMEIIKKEVTEVLFKVGLEGLEERSIHALSGGQRQRLALASVLITKPKLLILDEPVSQMNPTGVKDFLNLLKELNENDGITILVVEHRVNELASYFPRLVGMSKGEIVYDDAISKAWETLSGTRDIGLREPQVVTLCRELDLPVYSPDMDLVTTAIKTNYTCDATNSQQNIEREVLLKCEKISYKYDSSKTYALDNIDFNVKKGEIVALMGYNGAGKSTLMNLLAGLTETKEGTLFLNNEALTRNIHKVGYLRQEPDLMLLADTVNEELTWNNDAVSDDFIDDLLKRLKLYDERTDFPLALSKGQRLRTVLGAMLARKPELLLLDEPTTGQDRNSLEEIIGLILGYAASGGSVFFCTHDVELAGNIADRVIILKDGKIIADDAANTIFKNKELLIDSGLTIPPMVLLTEKLGIPSCINIKEVKASVGTSIVGRQ